MEKRGIIEKPTLQQIRQQMKTGDGQTITRQLLAEKAGLPYGDAYLLDIGGHLSGKKARKVLWAFHQLSGISLNTKKMKYGGSH